ncbi:hypothetical protein D9M71_386200 [compost metagenome]
MAASGVSRQGRSQEQDCLGSLFGQPQATQGNVFALCQLCGPLRPVEAALFAGLKAPAPLAGLDQADEDAVDPDALFGELGGHRAHQVLQPGTGRRGGDHVRLRLAGQQRVDADDRGTGLALQLGEEGAHRVDHREEFQLQLFAPGFVGGVGEGRDPALAGVVDQHLGRAQRGQAGGGEGLHRLAVEHVADLGQQTRLGEALAQPCFGTVQALLITAAEGHRGAGFEQLLDASQANPGGAAGDDGGAPLQLIKAAHLNPSSRP